MRLVLVNINTNETLTQRLLLHARQVCSSDTQIIALTPRFGPESVESRYEGLLAAAGVIDALLSFTEPYDGVVFAGFGEAGREPLQELLDVPVVDITDAAAYLACLVSPNFSIVTTLPRAASQILERLHLVGLAGRCQSIRPTGLGVLEVLDNPAIVDSIVHQAREALAHDDAEAICLGCAAMAGLAPQIADRIQVPVIDGLTAAVTLLESLCRLGLSTSKRMTYSPPKDFMNIIGWPMEPTQ
jgi:allantoin racemase